MTADGPGRWSGGGALGPRRRLLMLLVAAVYLCSLAISLLFTEPLHYRQQWAYRAETSGVSRLQQQAIAHQEVYAASSADALEEVGADELLLAPVINNNARLLRAVQLRQRRLWGSIVHSSSSSSGRQKNGVFTHPDLSGAGNVADRGRRREQPRRAMATKRPQNNTISVVDHTSMSKLESRFETPATRAPRGQSTGGADNGLPEYQLVIHQDYLCHQVDEEADVATNTSGTKQPTTSRTRPVYLLIIVHSHPAHKRRRNSIRETWGRVVRDYDRGRQVAVVFALGLPRDYDEYRGVQREARLYRDVVVWDFTDDYRNLTLKSLAGFRWAAAHCAGAKFIMKADDDVYVNVPYLTDYVLPSYPTSSLILGSLNSNSPVRRYGQWRVTREQYAQPLFPPYCSGCAYVISADMAGKLYQAAIGRQAPPLIPVEDVYVTGLLAEKLGVTCRHHPQFPTWITVPSVGLVQQYLKRELVGLHGVDWIRMHSMWHMIRQCPTCATDAQQAKRWLSWVMDKDPMYR